MLAVFENEDTCGVVPDVFAMAMSPFELISCTWIYLHVVLMNWDKACWDGSIPTSIAFLTSMKSVNRETKSFILACNIFIKLELVLLSSSFSRF